MKAVFKLVGSAVLALLVVGCASQQEPPETAAPAVSKDVAPEPEESRPQPELPPALATPDVAVFVAADGTTFEDNSIVEMPTGGPPAGRLVPGSSDPSVTLYVTRDGSVPAPDNNWGGPIDPESPPSISRPLEGVATYRVAAAIDDRVSEPFTLTVVWRHEPSPELAEPEFVVDGRAVEGSVSIPVSDGDDPAARLQIRCDYSAATLYITRDGSEPTVDEHWRTQLCEGTYLWSPEPTAADYRVVAVWQGARSPVAELRVEWVE